MAGVWPAVGRGARLVGRLAAVQLDLDVLLLVGGRVFGQDAHQRPQLHPPLLLLDPVPGRRHTDTDTGRGPRSESTPAGHCPRGAEPPAPAAGRSDRTQLGTM